MGTQTVKSKHSNLNDLYYCYLCIPHLMEWGKIVQVCVWCTLHSTVFFIADSICGLSFQTQVLSQSKISIIHVQCIYCYFCKWKLMIVIANNSKAIWSTVFFMFCHHLELARFQNLPISLGYLRFAPALGFLELIYLLFVENWVLPRIKI